MDGDGVVGERQGRGQVAKPGDVLGGQPRPLGGEILPHLHGVPVRRVSLATVLVLEPAERLLLVVAEDALRAALAHVANDPHGVGPLVDEISQIDEAIVTPLVFQLVDEITALFQAAVDVADDDGTHGEQYTDQPRPSSARCDQAVGVGGGAFPSKP